LGLHWAAPTAAAPVTSVFGRTGAVVAVTGDYTAAQVTNAVDKTVQYSDPPWIMSLSWSKIVGGPTGGQNQTPWMSDIHGATFRLNNAFGIGIGAIAGGSSYAVYARRTNPTDSFLYSIENTGVNGWAGFIAKASGDMLEFYAGFGGNTWIRSQTAMVLATG